MGQLRHGDELPYLPGNLGELHGASMLANTAEAGDERPQSGAIYAGDMLQVEDKIPLPMYHTLLNERPECLTR